MEDFVREPGAEYLEQIDEAATRGESFRSALSYTYGWDKVPGQVRDRLAHRFPDGDPEGEPFRVTLRDAD